MQPSPLNAPLGGDDLPDLPPSPVDPSQKWLAFAAGALSPTQGGHFSESLSNALGGMNAQANRDTELQARYAPMIYNARMQRAQAKIENQQRQAAQMKVWNDTMMGGMASLLDKPVIMPQDVAGAAQAAVAQRGVPPQYAQQFLQGLPMNDPAELTAYIRRASIAAQDPFRHIAKPELKSVGADDKLVSIGPNGQPTTIAQGEGKPSDLAKLQNEMAKLPPGDPRRAEYADAIRKATTHQPPIASVTVNPEKTMVNAFTENFGKAISEAQQAASGAQASIATVHRMRDALESGKVMAGPGTKFALVAAQIGSVMGVNGRNTEEIIVNTRQALQSASQLELDAASQMKGQGSITDAERKLLKDTTTNLDNMTVAELRAVAGILERRARERIKLYNKQAERLYGLKDQKSGKQIFGEMPKEMFLIEEPPPYGSHEVIKLDGQGRPVKE